MASTRFTRFALPFFALLAGCSTAGHIASPALPASTTTAFHGSVHGGQQPITGATINIYAVGTTGFGSAASSVLAAPIITDSNGYFDLTNKVTCPSPASLLYLVATGGNPGVAPPFSGLQISLMTILGQCGNPNNIQFINVNEVTTVAAIYGLVPFMLDATHVGSSPTDVYSLTQAFNHAWEFADITNGTSPGSMTVTGAPFDITDVTIPTAQINSLANLLSGCINSTGGTAGDSTFCGQFFTLLKPSYGAAPTDTVSALLNLALTPGVSTSALYHLIPPVAPFQPALTQPPVDFSVATTDPFALQISSSSLNFGSNYIGVSFPEEVTIGPGLYIGSSDRLTGVVTGPAANDFTLSGPPDETSCINGSADPSLGYHCYLYVTFKPSAPGKRVAILQYALDTSGRSRSIPLFGFGSVPATTPLTLSPSVLEAPLYNTPYTVTVTNPGSSSVPIVEISTSPYYSQTNNCGTVLLAQASCIVNVLLHSQGQQSLVYFPPPGSLGGSLNVSSGSAGSPTLEYASIVSLISAYIPPDSLNLGTQATGTTGSITYSFNSNDRSSGGASFSISGANASDFSFTQESQLSNTACSWNMYNACDLTVYFTPSATGLRTATIIVPGVGLIPISGTGQ